MAARGGILAAALSGALLLAAAPAPAGDDLAGPGQVVDGDGLYVEGREIRLQGIDAPEWKQACKRPGQRKWMAGQEASAVMSSLLAAAPVACQDTGARSYKRIVAVCYRDGEDLGLTMVRLGWAFDAPKFSHGRYAAAEQAAREAGRGMWQGECEKPWIWRKANR